MAEENVTININAKNNTKAAFAGAAIAITGLSSALAIAQKVMQAGKRIYDETVAVTIEYAEQVRQLSRTIGSTPEDASKLIQAADDVKVSFETMQTAMNIAIRNGIEPTIDGMGKLADQYLAIEDPIARSKFLLDTFGRSGGDMAAMMELGSEGIRELGNAAEATGLVLDEKAIKNTRDFEIAVDNLQDKLRGTATQIGLRVIPSLTGLTNALSLTTLNADLLSESISGVVDDATESVLVLTQTALAIEAFVRQAITLNDLLGYLANGFFNTSYSSEGLTADIGYLNFALGNTTPVVDAAGTAVDALGSEMGDATTKTSALEQATLDLQAAQSTMKTTADFVRDAFREQGLELENNKWLMDQIALATGEMTAEEMAQRDAINDLTAAYADGTITQSEYLTAILATNAAMLEGQGMAFALAAALDGLPREIRTKILIEQFGYKTGNWGNIGDDDPQMRAQGGSVYGNSPYIVGEQGPELFVPQGSGTIIPNNKLGGGANIYVTINTPVNLADRVWVERELAPYIRQGIREASARG